MKGKLLFILLLSNVVLCAQTIIGPTTVEVNSVHTYEVPNSVSSYSAVFWDVNSPQGTVISAWQSGQSYFASIRWNNSGTIQLKLYGDDNLLGALFVGVGSAPPPPSEVIIGPSLVVVGSTHTYSITGIAPYNLLFWDADTPLGTVVSTWSVGSTYYASISWNSAGVVPLELYGDDNLLNTLNVTIDSGNPPVPNAFFTQTNYCGTTTVSRVIEPPAGANYSWYWQVSPNGTSTTLGNQSSLSVTTAGNIYLRARLNSSPHTWSSASQLALNAIIINSPPAAPAAATDASRITNGGFVTLSVSPVAGVSYYSWYAQASGGTAILGPTTNVYAPNVSENKIYYVEAVDKACSSLTRKAVTATIYPEPVLKVSNNGWLSMGNQVTLSVDNFQYDSYAWLDEDNNEVYESTGPIFVVNTPGKFKLKVTKGSAPPYYTQFVEIKAGFEGLNQNYVHINSPQIPVTVEAAIENLTVEQNSKTFEYFDGLGRLIQTVNTQFSPLKHDVVQPQVYDSVGRRSRAYLPFTSTYGNGWFREGIIDASSGDYVSEADAFYSNPGSSVAPDEKPFSITVFENSLLNRVQKQGAPGTAWQPDDENTYDYANDRTIKHSYQLNMGNEVLYWTYTPPSVTYPLGLINAGSSNTVRTYYSQYELFKIRTKDESQNEVIEYIDKQGRTILKRVQVISGATVLNETNYASTYYIYDDFGNLVCVVPPEASRLISQSSPVSEYFGKTDSEKNGFLARWAYRYAYDTRNRVTQKQLPGVDPIYLVYDNRNRIVLTQDGNQRTGLNKNWIFTKYDVLNRPVMTGIHTADSVLAQSKMQRRVNLYYSSLASNNGSWYEKFVGASVSNVHGYDNKSYPVEVNPHNYLTVTYYDNYDFRSLWSGSYTYLDENLSEIQNGATYNQPDVEFATVKGQVTGTKVKILDGGTNWLKSVTYYDDDYRAIQTIADNQTGGTDRTTTVYDFTGKPLETKSTHNALWRNHVGVSVSANSITKTIATTSWTNAGAASVKPLGAGQNGYIELTVSETTSTRMIGFSINDENQDYTTMDFSVYLNQTTLYAYERTINRGSKGTIATGDVIRLDRTGTSVKIYKNGTLLYTFPTSSATALYADCSLNSIGATLTGITLSWSPESHTVTRRMEYDHAGRLINTWHKLDGNNEILLSKNIYNELGQLIDKKLHSTLANGSDAKQSVDYRYNIRGWLTKINESDVNNSLEAGEPRDLFGMELGYNTDIGVSNTALYNGNISAIKWSNNLSLGDVKENAYTYSYDPMNRLTASTYKQKNGSWASAANNGFAETGFTYDLNGNILTLQRNDGRASNWMDNLIYNYGTGTTQSNKLLSVTDNGDDFKGFIDGTNSSSVNDYTYDANGNMITDLNKNILAALPITYNHLNLPETVSKGTSTIRYTYDATGRKLFQTVSGSGPQKQTDYLGEYVYTNGALQFVNHEEGRIAMASEESLFSFDGGNQTGITKTGTDITLTNETNNGETYLKITVAAGATKRGVSAFRTPLAVTAGDRYVYRVRGYRGGEAANLYVKGNTADIIWPGASLPNNINIEAWVETYFTIPPGVTQIELGVMLNTANASVQNVYVNEAQLIKLGNNSTAEYQYHLKDHLGNVRLTFTTKVDAATNTATLETANAANEQSQFLRFAEARKIQSFLFDRTNGSSPTTTTGYAQRLNGSANEKYGLGKSISVMPGDVISASVYAKYIDPVNSNWTTALSNLLSQIAAGTAPAGTVVDGGSYGSSTANFPFSTQAAQNTATSTETGPKVYLNWLVFDRNYNFIAAQSGYDRLSSAPKEAGQDVAHELLQSPQITIKQPGYVYIYLSNEETATLEAYFDDFTVTHTKSPVIQQDDYYAFGLNFNSYQRENATANQYLYNGQEKQDELDLGWLDYGARMYVPEIARFYVVDPFLGIYPAASGYSYAWNSPIIYIDKDGKSPTVVLGGLMAGGFALYGVVTGKSSKEIAGLAALGFVSGVTLGVGTALIGAAGGVATIGAANAGYITLTTGIGGGMLGSLAQQFTESLFDGGKIDKHQVILSGSVGFAEPLLGLLSTSLGNATKKAIKEGVEDALTITYQEEKQMKNQLIQQLIDLSKGQGRNGDGMTRKEAQRAAEKIIEQAKATNSNVIDATVKVTNRGVEVTVEVGKQAVQTHVAPPTPPPPTPQPPSTEPTPKKDDLQN